MTGFGPHGGFEVLPCGCTLEGSIIDGEKVLTVVPCRPDCTTVADLAGLAGGAGIPVTYEEAP